MDDTISLIRRVDSDWWEGLVGGKKGLVPANYIEVIAPPVTRNLKVTFYFESTDVWYNTCHPLTHTHTGPYPEL